MGLISNLEIKKKKEKSDDSLEQQKSSESLKDPSLIKQKVNSFFQKNEPKQEKEVSKPFALKEDVVPQSKEEPSLELKKPVGDSITQKIDAFFKAKNASDQEQPAQPSPIQEQPAQPEPTQEQPVQPDSTLKQAVQEQPAQSEPTVEIEKPKKSGRVATGIPGLDQVINGGLRKLDITLVGGGAGCGKSIFSMQFLVNGILQNDEPGVYISFEQTEEDLLRDFEAFGWNLNELIKKKKLSIVYYTPEQIERFFEGGGGMIRDLIDTIGAKRIVVDSLTAFSLLFASDLNKRRGLLRMFEAIKNWGITALMTSEADSSSTQDHKSSVVEFQVDAVILLYNVRNGDIRDRSLEVYKMRGSDHSAKIIPMHIDDNGITIFPEGTVF
jgi:KaiC/GvpD/RAD55 family RecA-like ATPase